jgi:hypothetical protein
MFFMLLFVELHPPSLKEDVVQQLRSLTMVIDAVDVLLRFRCHPRPIIQRASSQ